MGLDMYAMRTLEPISKPVDFKTQEATEIHRWRKHPNLHGWMEELYYTKGGKEEFNCVPVTLTADDLNRLEKALKTKSLPHTQGFFFGTSDDADTVDDLTFIEKARKAIAQGYTVYYDSWW